MEVSLECWQDREIRFDLPLELLKPRRGETEIDSINSVEDTKGNNGLKGHFSVTNLRLIWLCHDDPRTNLSIGWACVSEWRLAA
jgi:Bardet-Biedl syndrome 5 protein